MRIEKKIWPEYFQAVLEGKKRFELRLADFKCNPGDVLVLKEWDPDKKSYTGRVLEKKITYVLKTNDLRFWPDEDIEKYGLQILSLE